MISTADLQDWMKADDVDAPVLRRLEESAIQAIQHLTGHYYGVTATLTEDILFRGWPLELANTPIGGVITSLSQWDGSTYATVTSTDYYVRGSFIYRNSTSTYPTTIYFPQRYRAVYQAGYTVDPLDADVWPAPADVQQAVRLLVGNWFENREGVVIGTITTELELAVKMLLSSQTRVTV